MWASKKVGGTNHMVSPHFKKWGEHVTMYRDKADTIKHVFCGSLKLSVWVHFRKSEHLNGCGGHHSKCAQFLRTYSDVLPTIVCGCAVAPAAGGLWVYKSVGLTHQWRNHDRTAQRAAVHPWFSPCGHLCWVLAHCIVPTLAHAHTEWTPQILAFSQPEWCPRSICCLSNRWFTTIMQPG